jgi:triacylglycerol lipase
MTASYTNGLATSSAYRGLTAYYPTNGTGPYVVVLIHPWLNTAASLMGSWGTFLASHGYVGVTVSPPSDSDFPDIRANALWAAVATMKVENTRSGSALNGKSSNCFVVMGHSMGGGGSLLASNAHLNDIQGAIGLNPWQSSGNFSKIVSPTLILTGQNDDAASPAQHGRAHYNSIPATTTKQYVEASGGNHQSAFSPRGRTGRYALSWIKYTIDGDARYRPLLDQAASGVSVFETTVK